MLSIATTPTPTQHMWSNLTEIFSVKCLQVTAQVRKVCYRQIVQALQTYSSDRHRRICRVLLSSLWTCSICPITGVHVVLSILVICLCVWHVVAQRDQPGCDISPHNWIVTAVMAVQWLSTGPVHREGAREKKSKQDVSFVRMSLHEQVCWAVEAFTFARCTFYFPVDFCGPLS